jgi:hypothetical protein
MEHTEISWLRKDDFLVYLYYGFEHNHTNHMLSQYGRCVGQILAPFMFKPIHHNPFLEARNPIPKRVASPWVFLDIGDL